MAVVFGRWQRPIPFGMPLSRNYEYNEGCFTFEIPLKNYGRTNFFLDLTDQRDAYMPDEKLNRFISSELNNVIDLDVKTDFLELSLDDIEVELADEIITVYCIYHFRGKYEDHKTENMESFYRYMNDVSRLIYDFFEENDVCLPEGNVSIDEIRYEECSEEDLYEVNVEYRIFQEDDDGKETVWYGIRPGEPYFTEKTFKVFRKYDLPAKEEI